MITFEQYAEHLQMSAAAAQGLLEGVTFVITDRAVERAKSYIGHQQDGWQPLAESTVEGWDSPWGRHFLGKREMGFSPPDFEPLFRSGEMEESISGETEGTTGVVGSPDIVALWQEMGTRRMPARPFLAKAVEESIPDIEAECGELAMQLLVPEY